MIKRSKQLSSSFSTGSVGAHFEAHVQASYLTLMLSGGYAPYFPCWPIIKIKLQGRIDGFETDDVIVFVENPVNKETRKLIGQVKHTIQITKGNPIFSEFIQAAWNDFNNPEVFTKTKDVIALITGPLNKTDFDSVHWILNQSRQTLNADEFFRYVNRVNFSPPKASEKLEVFRYHLRLANNNCVVLDAELYSFLKHFCLIGYDLGKEEGVVLSLLHSHISQFNKDIPPRMIWGRIVDIVQTWNQNAGLITHDNLPEDIKDAFRQLVYEKIPEEFVKTTTVTVSTDWNQHPYATELALMNLVGSWCENNTNDVAVINSIVTKDFDKWIPILREILQISNGNILLINGNWIIKNRLKLVTELGQRIFDGHLEQFKKIAISVLKELDPSFERPSEVRYLISFQDKTLQHSKLLRKGVAEGLALVGNHSKALIHCSRGKADIIVILVIREIFKEADWILWASLNDLLPILAEASPKEFLTAVENALRSTPCPYDILFSQEGKGISGNNYMTGLLWALEALAWDEELFVRVCVILGELASHDPGGSWSNRPANSLSNILLPWMPQTMAPIEKRIVAVETLFNEQPDIAWNLIIKLLPNQHQTTMGTYKPIWRNTIPTNWEKGVTNEEYWRQMTSYAEIAVSIASKDVKKLSVLIDHLDNLPRASFDMLLEILSDGIIKNLQEENRLEIWQRLRKFTTKHRRYSDQKWALGSELLTLIEKVTNGLAPSNPLNLYQHLFSDRDIDLFEEKDNWEEEIIKLNERRKLAIIEIMDLFGLEAVLTFAEMVQLPYLVGSSLGKLATTEIDSAFFPKCLNIANQKHLKFIEGYIWSNYYRTDGRWADELNKTKWTDFQTVQFLMLLPFNKETWDCVSQWLGKNEDLYWLKINPNPNQAVSGLDFAVDKFLTYKRPHLAIECLYVMRQHKQELDKNAIAKALLMMISIPIQVSKIDSNDIIELIKVLQDDLDFDQEKLFQVEWAYLHLLDHQYGASPKLLENRLATNPDFFCEAVQLIYRSKNEIDTVSEKSEQKRALGLKIWRLLHEWRTPPGSQTDGSFNETHFSSWMQRVKMSCTESGHWEAAQTNIGAVLIYCPKDQNGLWINKTVANALNYDDAKDMRDGFRTAFFNTRGAHWVDPTGNQEKQLAEKYRQKANDIEKVGCYRLAVTLRELAEDYDREADQNIEEHNRRVTLDETN